MLKQREQNFIEIQSLKNELESEVVCAGGDLMKL